MNSIETLEIISNVDNMCGISLKHWGKYRICYESTIFFIYEGNKFKICYFRCDFLFFQ